MARSPVDTDPDRLWRGLEEVPLRAKSLSVLAYLARRPGHLVTKDELREQIWGATHVSDTTLRVTVREIRAALGDDATGSSYLETVPGRGYRFLPRPEVSSDLESAASQRGDRPPAGQGGPIVGRRREVEHLLNRFLEAKRGRRQIVVLAGEQGAGKTTLVQLFMERLEGRPGTTLVTGQCVMSFGKGEAYGPVLEALGRLAAEPGVAGVTFADLLPHMRHPQRRIEVDDGAGDEVDGVEAVAVSERGRGVGGRRFRQVGSSVEHHGAR